MKKIWAILVVVTIFLTMPLSSLLADGSGLAVGVQAPNFTGVNDRGESFELIEAYADNPIILIFYRGGWCPYCNFQLQMFEKKIDAFKAKGIDVVAVSVDTLAEVTKMKKGESYGVELAQKNPDGLELEKIGYSFDIVGNISVEALKAYNAIQQIDDETHEKYLDWGIDLEASSGKTHHIVAIPATYVINRDGEIIFAESDRDYKERTMPETVLMFLDSLER